MSAHSHVRYVPGCFRCELGRDEAAECEAEDRRDAQAAWVDYRDAQVAVAVEGRFPDREYIGAAVRRTLRRREFVAGFIAGRQS